MDERSVFAITRPHPKLLLKYIISSVLTGPGVVIMLPMLYFRYHTMRYRFDDEGVHMRWGLLFRREINLTYARIQDIHLVSGPVQRWLGLADIKIQTASGSAAAEMTIEGMLQYEEIRTFLYTKMRGYRDRQRGQREQASAEASTQTAETVALLKEIQAEMRATREALARLSQKGGGDV